MKRDLLLFLMILWSGTAFAFPPVMPQAPGGSGAVATDTIWAAAGDLVQGTGNDTSAVLTAGGTAGMYLRSAGAGAANIWSTLILPNAGSAFYLPAFTSANTMGQLAASGTTGQVLTAVTGAIPAWAALPTNSDSAAGVVTSGAGQNAQVWKTDAAGVPGWRADATGGGTTMANDAVWAAKGDLAVASANDTGTVLTVGTAYQVLHTATDTPGWTSTLGATGTRLTKGWFTDLEVTNAIAGSVTGNAATVTVAASADATSSVAFFETTDGSLGAKTDPGLTYDATANILTATGGFAGPLNGTVGATTPAAGSFTSVTVSPSASPTMLFGDSDALGADKEIGKLVGAYIDGADGAENGTVSIYAHEAGTTTEYIQADGKNVVIDLLKPVVAASTIKSTGALTPASADGAALGSTSLEWADLYLADGGKIYFQNDQSVYLTPSASTLTLTGNFVATGTVQAGIAVSSDADGMDAAAMTAAGVRGTMFIATGAGTWILPRAVLGDSLCLMDSGTAHDLILDVTAGSTVRLKGTEQADGVGITNASGTSTGDFVCVVAVATDKWSTVGMQGTWASQ